MKLILTESVIDDLMKNDESPEAMHAIMKTELEKLGNSKLTSVVQDSKVGDKTTGTRLINICIEAAMEEPQVWEKLHKILKVAPVKKSMDPECCNALVNFLIQNTDCDINGKVMSPIWKSKELWDSTRKEFDYTVRIFYNVSDSSKVKKFFDYNTVKVAELWQNNKVGGTLKPAGIATKDEKDLNTIYGTVESWSRASEAGASVYDRGEEKEEAPVKSKEPRGKKFSSFEDADKDGQNRDGNVIRIEGYFSYDKKTKTWKPVKQ